MIGTKEIRNAVVAHRKWRERLQRAMESNTSEYQPVVVRLDTQCDFGKWLHTQVSVEDQQDPHYVTAKQLHATFHQEAANVLELALQGRKAQAAAAMSYEAAFGQTSAALTSELMTWFYEIAHRSDDKNISASKVQAILEERARALAKSADTQTGESMPLVVFSLANETYGIATEHVREVQPLRGVTPVPCTPEFVVGVINIRGSIYSVIDIRSFFGVPKKEMTDSTKVILVNAAGLEVGILADDVSGATKYPGVGNQTRPERPGKLERRVYPGSDQGHAHHIEPGSPVARRAHRDSRRGRLAVAFTFFFRDNQTLDLIAQYALPELKRRNYINVWDAGCAHGPEPYSLAIIFRENMGHFLFRNLRIYATDIDEGNFGPIIARGAYRETDLQRIPAEIRGKYFVPDSEPGMLRVCDEIRDSVRFERHDLLSLKPPRDGFGLIVCKNVLLHFSPDERVAVIKMFHRTLTDGGFFVTEQTQKLPPGTEPFFRQVTTAAQLYQKIEPESLPKETIPAYASH